MNNQINIKKVNHKKTNQINKSLVAVYIEFIFCDSKSNINFKKIIKNA